MIRRLAVSTAALGTYFLCAPVLAHAAFGFLPGAEGFAVSAVNKNGTPTTQSGAHPYTAAARLAFQAVGGESDGDLRDLRVSYPPGLLVNPATVAECSAVHFSTPRSSPYEASASGESCPNPSQIGTVSIKAGSTTRRFGLFSLAAPFGSLASLGASPFGTPLEFAVHVREADAGLDLELQAVPPNLDLQGMEIAIWGTPWDIGHDGERGNCLNEVDPSLNYGTLGKSSFGPPYTGYTPGTCSVPNTPKELEEIKSYLTMPTTPCGSPLAFAAIATSWDEEASPASATILPLTKCNKPLVIPELKLMTDHAASRTGLAFNIDVSDGGGIVNPLGIARPAIKEAILSLPEGLTVNPSLGAGLGSCTEAQFAREAATSEPGAGCPNNSKIGEVGLEGTLGLTETLHGSLYVATPYENPFHDLLAVYMLARLPRRGLIVKSEGKIEPDPRTGRLVVTFDDLPRLLYTHFGLTLREGQRSTLVSPPLCGSYLADLALASWAEPSLFRHEPAAFSIYHGEADQACPSGETPPFTPMLLAGSLNPTARVFTPFYMRMSRADAEQEITSYSAIFPPGLLAKIAGVTTCSDQAIEAAKSMSGFAEIRNPSCPASSRIGRTEAGYGVGGTLAYAPGEMYLGGPYHGAPLSTVAIDSATIGPFDLGTVVVRSAIRIDPRTAQASIDSAGSDPIPHILAGIPIHLRDIRVYIDRPNFTLNPTSCDPMKVFSTLTGAGAELSNPADDPVATVTGRFQVLSCSVLNFKPRLSILLVGSARHGGFPSLRATYTPRPGNANLQGISVILPSSLFLAQQHIAGVCTRVQFRQEACPASSVYGHARAVTPLMDEALEGPVYLRSSSRAVPDVVADLHGRGIEIEVPGRIDTANSGIRANFENLPDAPVTKFTVTLAGKTRGLLQNGEGLCAETHRANARFIAQSNATHVTHPILKVRCGRHGREGGGHQKAGK